MATPTVEATRPRSESEPATTRRAFALRRSVADWRWWPVLIALIAFFAYLQPALRVLQLNPDVVEYIDVGRRIAAGDGFLLGVKAYHFGGTEVLHDGLAERAPLYPLLVALVIKLGLPLTALQVVNAALAASCALSVYLIAAELFGPRVALVSAVLAGASPVVLARMLPPMTEALTVALTLLATWLALLGVAGRPQMLIAAGGVLGLAYLARPVALCAAIAISLAIVLFARDYAARVRLLARLMGGVGVVLIPTAIWSLWTRDSLSYSGQTYLYAVFKDSDVLRNGYGRLIPTPLEFISQNPEFVAAAILDNAVEYGSLLFLDREWLVLLLPGLLAAIWATARGRMPALALLPLLVAAANFAIYAATWANYQERYQLLTLLLLIPFAVFGLSALGLDRLQLPGLRGVSALLVAGTLVVALWIPTFRREYGGEFKYGDETVRSRSDRGLSWTGPPRWVQDNELSRMVDWIHERTQPSDALAHGQPWPYTFFTRRPATLLPTKLTPELLRSFITDYRVAYVLLDTRDRDRRHYGDDLDALRLEGVRVSNLGSHRIYDTRPLWAGQ